MAARNTGGRKPASIRTLWAIAKSPKLGLTDEDLHAVVYRETGKESMKKLSQGEINTVARVLQKKKDGVERDTKAKRIDEGGLPSPSAIRSLRGSRASSHGSTRRR